MAKKKPAPSKEEQAKTDAKKAARELAVLRGYISAMQRRCAEITLIAGDAEVTCRRKDGPTRLGEAMYELIWILQSFQAETLDLTNQIRAQAGMADVGPSPVYLQINQAMHRLVEQTRQELGLADRRSGGPFTPSHASVRRDERPPSTTRRNVLGEI